MRAALLLAALCAAAPVLAAPPGDAAKPALPALKTEMSAWGTPFRELVGPAFAAGESIEKEGRQGVACRQFRMLLGAASTHLPPSPDPEIDRLTRTGLATLKTAAEACLSVDSDVREEGWTWYFFRGQADLRLVQRLLAERYGVPGPPELSGEYKGAIDIGGETVHSVLLEREANLGALEETVGSAEQKRRRVLAWHPRYAAAAAPVKSALAEVLADPRNPGAACGRLRAATTAFLASPALPVPHPVLQTAIEAAYWAFHEVANACLRGDPELAEDKVDEAERHLGLAAQALAGYGLQP
jgi:hypothetical protein